MTSGLKAKWEELSPERKQKTVVMGLFAAIGGLALLYWMVAKAPAQDQKPAEEFKQLSLGKDMFEDDISQTVQKTRQELEQDNKARDKKVNSLEGIVLDIKKELEKMSTQPLEPPAIVGESGSPSNGFPVPPVITNTVKDAASAVLPKDGSLDIPIIVGGIGHVEAEKLTTPGQGDEDKKKVKKVYLPPSFMDAMLLTGLDASTVEGANAHPQPFMLRVQEPAVLPNSIKANLKGCFVIGHGYGALNSERVESRLVSLNCLGEDGQAVIDTPIKGYVADKDGKSGLKGIVVSKQGAALARVFAAGVVGGFGSVAEAAANTVTIAPTTSVATTTVDSEKLVTAGLGKGIADSSKELRKFYLDLAKQASPVIEVGPAKKVTVVITEGVWIEIRENKDA